MSTAAKFELGRVSSGLRTERINAGMSGFRCLIFADNEHDNTSCIAAVYGDTPAIAEARRDFILNAINKRPLKIK